jgi:hypothetical protein
MSPTKGIIASPSSTFRNSAHISQPRLFGTMAGSPSQALAKRSTDNALMPPPPPPKRQKRPAKVLDEDVYTDALSHIIARDFFPGLVESEAQQQYLTALDSKNNDWIREAGRNLTQVMTPGPDGRRRQGSEQADHSRDLIQQSSHMSIPS